MAPPALLLDNEPASSTKSGEEDTFTEKVIRATGPNAHPRLAEITPTLIRHLHAFARETHLTVAEWMMGVEFINECGRLSTDCRNETALLCDILGLESLVDELTTNQLAKTSPEDACGAAGSVASTASAILGPFYRVASPLLPNGASIVQNLTPEVPWYHDAIANTAFVSGRVLSGTLGTPIRNASVEVWHSAPNGLYEQQDEQQADMNLRGRFRTDAKGWYAFYALRPTPYPIPSDGPSGRLLELLDRHPYRPAHIHFIVSAIGHRTLTTQVFDSRDRYITNDAVFAVKDDLVVHFTPRQGDERARWTLDYDFVLTETVGQ